MKSTILAQQTILLPRADNLQTAQTHDGPYKGNEEFIIDCPDCFDTMVKIYELDKVRYQCENCDLVIPEMKRKDLMNNLLTSYCSTLLGTIRYSFASPSVWSVNK